MSVAVAMPSGRRKAGGGAFEAAIASVAGAGRDGREAREGNAAAVKAMAAVGAHGTLGQHARAAPAAESRPDRPDSRGAHTVAKTAQARTPAAPDADTTPRTVHVLACDGRTGAQSEISYSNLRPVGNGSFGIVYAARMEPSGEMVALKKVLQDRRFKNRELQIMRLLNHPNVVLLRYYFYTAGDRPDDVFLNLVLDFVPETIHRCARQHAKLKQLVPTALVKVYMWQLLRSLGYIHGLGVCHRDIKPQNLLLDPSTGVLKLCDFGSAKILVPGEANVAYICSRYYRAPELIFGATHYGCGIDVWSAGCVMAELLLGHPLFPGESGVDQLVEIIKVLGTPTREQIAGMNPNYTEYKFPQIKAASWTKVFRARPTTPEALDLLSRLLSYVPSHRPSALEALAHPFFDELRQPGFKMPGGRDPPQLFDFKPGELRGIERDTVGRIVPHWAWEGLKRHGVDCESVGGDTGCGGGCGCVNESPAAVAERSQALAGNPNNVVTLREVVGARGKERG